MKTILEELNAIPAARRRALRPLTRGADPMIEIDGRKLINLSSNNYLSLASHPRIIEAAVRALREDGAGAGASRLVSGTTPRLTALEERIAALKGTPRALVTTSGFTAAQAAITTLVGRDDAVIVEKGAHASLVAAARLAGAALSVFRRADPEGLERALRRAATKARRRLVLVDGVHSMDGDIVPLPTLLPIIEKRGALLLIDDAHATGTIGPHGEGTLAHFNIPAEEWIIQMGTLSKALASQGGFLAAAPRIIELIIQRAGAFIYTTALNPAAVGAARAAIEILADEPERLARLGALVNAVRRVLDPDAPPTPIIPMILGSDEAALAAAKRAVEAGLFVPAIRPPTVAKGTARLRFSIQADHPPEALLLAMTTLKQRKRSAISPAGSGTTKRGIQPSATNCKNSSCK